jgi:hypothetical protein
MNDNQRPVRTYASKSRCPKCRSLRTKAQHTGKVKQYRVCLNCGHSYREGGVLI